MSVPTTNAAEDKLDLDVVESPVDDWDTLVAELLGNASTGLPEDGEVPMVTNYCGFCGGC
ncbi:hypothetical protein [Spongiactinospora sp. TRM90649]|uniref:hypothetical protein n=1 Tax=Spongiactinospora sp. TRM90649 TaxID=3031114 RepID=UPI0023F93195|nr:hypothetical protein [Spongiactinospora sp. TRM90649]MDF5757594.1 hypothetical protein [Spongiactinospora sp. TRM90649]